MRFMSHDDMKATTVARPLSEPTKKTGWPENDQFFNVSWSTFWRRLQQLLKMTMMSE
jgi:hypothetical protein